MFFFDIALFFVSQYKRIWNDFFCVFKSNEIGRTNSLLCSICFNSIFNPFILQIEIIIQATWKITCSLYKNNFIFNTLLTINLNSVFRNPKTFYLRRWKGFEILNQNIKSVNAHPSSPANDNSNKIVGFAGKTEQSIDFSDLYAQTVIGTNTYLHQSSYCDFFFKNARTAMFCN